uniref:J domain-containing protein n=1 Tax=Globisporangium ultimum (strain ATCC 200006 / CBS 805.95 / DAOM BR144) TaxID=431595 RepID=K3WB54_GLOUD
MGASDSFTGFVYQVFIISPAISWILQPGRFSKQRGFVYAVSFLVALAAISIFMQFKEQESNFYHVMAAPRDASFSEIKKAFRMRSIDLHPDKNPSPTAVADFNRLRLAFDILGDAQKRALYDLFGESAVLKDLSAVQIESVIGSISFYAFWAVLTFLLTLSEAARDARAWSFAGGVLFFILEINLIFGGLQLPSTFFPFMTVYEFTQLLRAAFPPFVNGTRAIGGFYYRSFAQENFALGIELLNSNRAILLSMRQLQGEVASTRRRPNQVNTAAKSDALPPGAKRRSKFDKQAAAAPVAAPVQAEDEQQAAAVEQNLQNPTPEVQPAPSFNIPSFVYVIGFYLAINYFFQ